MRKTVFANGEYYHIYNRGVDKREVFLNENDYLRFLRSMKEFNREDTIGSLYEKYLREKKVNESSGSSTPIMGVELPLSEIVPGLVEIVCYCLNQNHYHFILKQLQDKGIEKFMQKLDTGYTNYFNKKYKRSGALFQGKYKSIHVDSNEYLLYLSAYVNKNNFIYGYLERKSDSHSGSRTSTNWSYSSYLDYIGKRNGKLCNQVSILSQFRNREDY